jgi:hypothetical protein
MAPVANLPLRLIGILAEDPDALKNKGCPESDPDSPRMFGGILPGYASAGKRIKAF